MPIQLNLLSERPWGMKRQQAFSSRRVVKARRVSALPSNCGLQRLTRASQFSETRAMSLSAAPVYGNAR